LRQRSEVPPVQGLLGDDRYGRPGGEFPAQPVKIGTDQ
jgi:hypothetical protein